MQTLADREAKSLPSGTVDSFFAEVFIGHLLADRCGGPVLGIEPSPCDLMLYCSPGLTPKKGEKRIILFLSPNAIWIYKKGTNAVEAKDDITIMSI